MQFITKAAIVAALGSTACAQYALPENEVPFIGGNVFKRHDRAIAKYPFNYQPPFDPSQYGGYYYWSVNNETVSASNFTGYDKEDGYYIPKGSYGTFPYFEVNEEKPKPINKTGSLRGQPKFKKILHVIFENEVFDWTMSDPYWQLLASKGKLLTNSHGITHPSLPNYAAILAGDFFGIAHEDFYNINATTIYDLLDLKGLSYGTYSEWYSPIATHRGDLDCNNYIFNGPIDSTNPNWASQIYRRLDVPALLFSTYTSKYERCTKMFDANNTFAAHVKAGALPEYSFYVPDMLHNAHDPMSDSSWLDLYLPELEKQGTLVVATFDEATWQNDDDTSPNNDNKIVTMLFGAGVTPHTKDDTYITHYGLLRGVIQNFNLGSLGRNDTNATNGNLYDLVN